MTGRVRLSVAWLFVIGLVASFWLMTVEPRRSLVDDEIGAAAEALDVWAEFASTGDIGVVSESFATNGPQFRRLQTEAATIQSGAPYAFELADADVVEDGVVRGTVIVSRDGEPDQVFHWDIEVVRDGDAWKLWTVRTSPSLIPNAGVGGNRHPEH